MGCSQGEWKSGGRGAGKGGRQARELIERVLAEAAGDVPVDSSYDDICKFILLNTTVKYPY